MIERSNQDFYRITIEKKPKIDVLSDDSTTSFDRHQSSGDIHSICLDHSPWNFIGLTNIEKNDLRSNIYLLPQLITIENEPFQLIYSLQINVKSTRIAERTFTVLSTLWKCFVYGFRLFYSSCRSLNRVILLRSFLLTSSLLFGLNISWLVNYFLVFMMIFSIWGVVYEKWLSRHRSSDSIVQHATDDDPSNLIWKQLRLTLYGFFIGMLIKFFLSFKWFLFHYFINSKDAE